MRLDLLGQIALGRHLHGEMKQLMLQHAFSFVDSVIFLVGLQNVRSQKALEKIGAVRCGIEARPEGRDSFVYRITASTFAKEKRWAL